MNYNEFCEELRLTVQSIIGADYKVSLMQVNKLNGVTRQSLVIQKDSDISTPNIYMEEYYELYQEGRNIETLSAEVISRYFQAGKELDFIVPRIKEFDMVKDKIFFKLINFDKNKALLGTLPYVKWLDLAVVFCILVKQDVEGIGSFYISNPLMYGWNVNIDTVYKHALINTPRLFGSSVRMMDDIIRDILGKNFESAGVKDSFDAVMDTILSEQSNANGFHKMYVASNSIGENGAVWLLYKEELHALSNKLKSDLYLLPSSIHEIIIIKADDKLQSDQLLDMVREVNDTQVPIQEVLSDNVYYFNRETDTVSPLV